MASDPFSIAQELAEVKAAKELAHEYGWAEDSKEYKDKLNSIRKKYDTAVTPRSKMMRRQSQKRAPTRATTTTTTTKKKHPSPQPRSRREARELLRFLCLLWHLPRHVRHVATRPRSRPSAHPSAAASRARDTYPRMYPYELCIRHVS